MTVDTADIDSLANKITVLLREEVYKETKRIQTQIESMISNRVREILYSEIRAELRAQISEAVKDGVSIHIGVNGKLYPPE